MNPSRKLSQYSFVSIAFYSFILAFLPLYFKSIGFSAGEISWLSAITTLATVIAPPLTMELVYRFFTAKRIATVLALLIPLSYLTFFFVQPPYVYSALLAFFIVSALKRSLDTLVETETIRRAAFGELYFEHVRVWGSIGFVLASFSMGMISDYFGHVAILYSGLVLLLLLLAITQSTTPLLQAIPQKAQTPLHQAPASTHWQKYIVLLATLISWASHGPFYVYFSIYLEALAWSKTAISLAWATGVVAEIAFFIYFPKIERHFGLLRIYQVSLLMTAIRWFLLSIWHTELIIFTTQLLHALSFTGVYLASIRLITQFSSEENRDRSQGMLLAVGQGAGSLIGKIGAGYLAVSLIDYTELSVLFTTAGYCALLGVALSLLLRIPMKSAEQLAKQ